MSKSRKEAHERLALPAPKETPAKETPASLMEAAQRDVEQLHQRIVLCEALAEVINEQYEEATSARRRLHLSHIVEVAARENRAAATEASKLCRAMIRRRALLRSGGG